MNALVFNIFECMASWKKAESGEEFQILLSLMEEQMQFTSLPKI
jgi:hypothetical protein